MASIQKRDNKWRAFVLLDGKRYSKTFRLKKEAVDWANEQELDGHLDIVTFKDLVDKYRPIATAHRGSKSELAKIRQIEKKVTFLNLPLEYINKGMIAAWRDARLLEVKPASVNREMFIIGCMFDKAINDWGWARSSPVATVSKPQCPPPRRRGIAQLEIDAIVAKLSAKKYGLPVAQMFELSIETAMRMGEMCNLTWSRVKEKYVILEMTKNGDRREVPLSKRAREIIEQRIGLDDKRVFPTTSASVTSTFIKAKKLTPYTDVRFHDARSEAVTRLSKKLDVVALAKMVGHRDLKSLMMYYAATSEDLADRL